MPLPEQTFKLGKALSNIEGRCNVKATLVSCRISVMANTIACHLAIASVAVRIMNSYLLP